MLAAGDELERVELGDEMAAGAVVADQHARAERVARRGKRLLLGEARQARSALPSSPFDGFQDGPRAWNRTSSLSSLRLAKKACHSGSTESGSCS